MPHRVGPAEAYQLMQQGYTYVDVRSAGEFLQGHPEGAINIPLMHMDPGMGMVPNDKFLAAVEALFPRDARLVLGCQSGGRSWKAAQRLESAGYTGVVDQRAGFGGARDLQGRIMEAGWKDSGLPVASTARPGADWDALQKRIAGH